MADEEGLLIQDEFPIWDGGKNWPPELKSDELVARVHRVDAGTLESSLRGDLGRPE